MSPTGYGAVSNAFVRALGIHDHSQIGSRAGVRLAFVLLPIRLCAPCHTPCIENYGKLNKSRPMGENVMMDKLESADDQVQADEAATSRRHVLTGAPGLAASVGVAAPVLAQSARPLDLRFLNPDTLAKPLSQYSHMTRVKARKMDMLACVFATVGGLSHATVQTVREASNGQYQSSS